MNRLLRNKDRRWETEKSAKRMENFNTQRRNGKAKEGKGEPQAQMPRTGVSVVDMGASQRDSPYRLLPRGESLLKPGEEREGRRKGKGLRTASPATLPVVWGPFPAAQRRGNKQNRGRLVPARLPRVPGDP